MSYRRKVVRQRYASRNLLVKSFRRKRRARFEGASFRHQFEFCAVEVSDVFYFFRFISPEVEVQGDFRFYDVLLVVAAEDYPCGFHFGKSESSLPRANGRIEVFLVKRHVEFDFFDVVAGQIANRRNDFPRNLEAAVRGFDVGQHDGIFVHHDAVDGGPRFLLVVEGCALL